VRRLYDEYHNTLANAWIDIGWYRNAIRHYKKSLKDTDDSIVIASMAWRYLQIDRPETALDYYRQAYQKRKLHFFTIGMAYSLCSIGNKEKARVLIKQLNESIEDLNNEEIEDLRKLEGIVVNINVEPADEKV